MYTIILGLRENGFVIVCAVVLYLRILYSNVGMNCGNVSARGKKQMFSKLLLVVRIGVPVRAGRTFESEKREGDFEILLLLDVVMVLIVETMDQDAMRKKSSSFKIGDMIGFIDCRLVVASGRVPGVAKNCLVRRFG